MARVGKVYIQNEFAGRIYETDDGYGFMYYSEYLKKETAVSVSLTMPLTTDEYKSKVLFPFFDGLIPEGWLLSVVEKNWKTDGKDRFGLMLAACRDCIGDVYVEEE